MTIDGDIKLALISDLHVYDSLSENETCPSYIRVGDVDSPAGTNPVVDLSNLIGQKQLRADLLLCLGDIADKARPAGLEYGWRKLNEVARQLGAQQIVATSGNHDCDSRYRHNDFDAKGALQALAPTYPIFDENSANHYWSRNCILFELEYCRIVSLNASAYHGGPPEEIEHGRVAAKTIDALKRALDSMPEKPLNILMCHHHPHSHSELGLGEGDVMKNGQALVDLLASGDYGRWVIVHGHKHHPKLSYAQGHGASPVVIACGSLSAALYSKLGTNIRNHFHILTANTTDIKQFGLAGILHSWEWTYGAGWSISKDEKGFPSRAGFGYRCDPSLLVSKITDVLGSEQRMAWNEVEKCIPESRFILPREVEIVQKKLKVTSNIELLRRDGLPFEIGRME